MKKLLLALALLLAPSLAFAQCNGQFPANTFCGNNTAQARPPFPIPSTGTGNVTGPGSSTVGDIPSFGNTIGTTLTDSGITAGSLNNLLSNAQNIINVQNSTYSGGAKGDCTTDDAGAIQAAINAANDNAVVLFPPPVTQVFSTVSISIASPGVVTLTGYGYFFDQPITFFSTGALPTGLVAGQTYYVKPIDANTFNVAAYPSGPSINTSGSQSGTQSTAPTPCYLIKSGLTLGNGSSSASSTVQNITLQAGAGLGGNQVLDSAFSNVRIMWGGASGSGTMLTTKGPISRRIVDLTFDGIFRANIGLSETSIYNSYDRMSIINTRVTAYREIPLQTLSTGLNIGTCANYHDQTQIFAGGTNNSTGIDLGFTASSGANADVCGETWVHITVITNSDSGSSGIILRGVDNEVFDHPVIECSSLVVCNVINVQSPTSFNTLPAEIVFQGAVAIGVINTPSNCTTWNPASNANHAGLYFVALMQPYSAAAPPSDSCQGAVNGNFTDGRTVGMSSPMQYAATADGTALSGTISLGLLKGYSSIPANSLRVGDTIRIRAAGVYTASNATAVNVTISVSAAIGPSLPQSSETINYSTLTLTTNETTQGWAFESDTTIRTVGVSGGMSSGFCSFNIIPYAGAGCAPISASPVAINTTVANPVGVQAQWGNNAGTNSITLKNMTVEVIHPAGNN